MKILYIYRNPKMGFSIGKVFKPIEEEMRKYAEVDSVELPCANVSISFLFSSFIFFLFVWLLEKEPLKIIQLEKYDEDDFVNEDLCTNE